MNGPVYSKLMCVQKLLSLVVIALVLAYIKWLSTQYQVSKLAVYMYNKSRSIGIICVYRFIKFNVIFWQIIQTGDFTEVNTTVTKLTSRSSLAAINYSLYVTSDNILLSSDSEELWTNQTVAPPNCRLLFKGDKDEISRVEKWKNQKWTIPSNEQFYQKVSSCDWIKAEFNRTYYVSEDEKNFPLAFDLNVHNSPQQIFRFLQVINRPHNVYCIHYDQKSGESFKKAMTAIADCLPNVIVASKIENVVRGWHTIVDAQMNCMSDLYKLRDRYPWRYVTTLCGKEVPLKTNKEIVRTLMKLNDTSAVELKQVPKGEKKAYWTYKYLLSRNRVKRKSQIKLRPPPYNLVMSKSLAYFSLSAQFVDFLLHNEKAIVFRKFTEDTFVPEEHFIPTLFATTGDYACGCMLYNTHNRANFPQL